MSVTELATPSNECSMKWPGTVFENHASEFSGNSAWNHYIVVQLLNSLVITAENFGVIWWLVGQAGVNMSVLSSGMFIDRHDTGIKAM